MIIQAPIKQGARSAGSAVIRLPNPMITLVWLSIFIPGHLGNFWVERGFAAFTAVFAAVILFAMPSNYDARQASRQAALFLTFIQFLFIFSFVHAIAFMGIETGMRDYFEVARYLILLLFVLYVLRHYDDRVRRATETAIAALLYFSLLVGFCFLRHVPVLTEVFKYGLYAHTKTAVTWFGDLRLGAPFENPNFYGFVVSQALAYMIFFSRSRLRLLHSCAALLGIYWSGSRTTWAGTFIILGLAAAVYTYLAMLRIQLKRAVQLGVAVLVLALLGVRFSGDIMKNHRLQALFSAHYAGGIHNEVDAKGRLEQDLQVIEYIKQSPVLGWGPSKYATFDYIDNQYLSWGMRNGLLGAFFLMIGAFIVAKRLIYSQRGNLLTTVGAWSFVLSIALQSMAAENLNNFRLFFITWFIGTAMARRPR